MAVDRIAAVAHKVAVAKSSVRSARNVATKPQRVTTGPLWLRLATSDPYTLSLDHPSLGHPFLRLVRTVFSFNIVLHHPTLVLHNFLAPCSNHTLLMAPLPLPGCHTYLVHIFRTQRLLLVINPLSHPIMAPPSSSSKFHLLLTFPRLGFQIQVVHTMQPMIHINSFRAVKLQEMNIS